MHYKRTDIKKGIDPAKNNGSKECIICRYWYFNDGLKFQHFICNGSHNLTMLYPNISDTAIITVKNADCSCIIRDMLEDRGYI